MRLPVFCSSARFVDAPGTADVARPHDTYGTDFAIAVFRATSIQRKVYQVALCFLENLIGYFAVFILKRTAT